MNDDRILDSPTTFYRFCAELMTTDLKIGTLILKQLKQCKSNH